MPGLISRVLRSVSEREILVLADLDDGPRGVAKDAPVAGGVGDLAGRHREGRSSLRSRRALGVHHAKKVVGHDERKISVEHQPERRVGAHRGQTRLGRVARPPLLRLDSRLHRRPEGSPKVRLDSLAPVPHNDHHLTTPSIQRSPHRIVHERTPGERVEHLGGAALHAGAVACGEDDGRGAREGERGLGHDGRMMP